MKIDFPGLILLLIFVILFYLLYVAASNKKINFAQMLLSEDNKASSTRLSMLIALAVSSWALMYILITKHGEIDTWLYVSYISVWSGIKVADKVISYRNQKKQQDYDTNTKT
jgi:ABC-type sulfate transport system permease component